MPTDAKTAQARREVQAAYDRQSAALLRKDVNGFLALCTRDYQDTKVDGHVYTADHIRQVLPAQIAHYPKQFTLKAAIKTFRLSGSRAEVTANRHLELMRTDSLRHTQVPWSSDTVTEDAWVKSGSSWLLQNSKETRFNKKTPPAPVKSTLKRPTGKTAVPQAR